MHPHRGLRLRLSRQNGNMTVCSLGGYEDVEEREGDAHQEEQSATSPSSSKSLRLCLCLSPLSTEDNQSSDVKQWVSEMLSVFTAPGKETKARRRSRSVFCFI